MAPHEERYHALDSLRGTMMLLGIYLHVVVGYSGDGHWPYIDKNPTSVLSWSLGVIHSFRMPAFFVMAGFFGALLWNRRGAASFISNRAHRILLPFALFWTILFPAVASTVIALQNGSQFIVPTFVSGAILQHLHPLHLWFLEYLLFLYTIGGLTAWAFGFLPGSWFAGIQSAYRWGLSRSYAPLLFAVFSYFPLVLMRGNLKDPDGFAPEFLILSAYIPPFAFGWLLYHSRDMLPRFEKNIWTYVSLAVPCFFVYGLASATRQQYLKAAGNVILCWLLIFAVIGIFLKFASAHSPLWRYVSDSSYWLYIMHMPVVIAFQVAFQQVPIPALAKIPIVLFLSVVVLLISYEAFVRTTWIGALLNGRRFPHGLPKPSNQPALTPLAVQ